MTTPPTDNAGKLSEANARLIETVDGWALAEECDLPLDRVYKLMNAARSEGPADNAGETRDGSLIDELMQLFADPYVEKLTYRAAVEIARLDAMIAAAPQPETAGEEAPVGTAEREVGRYIYMRIEALMGAEFETPEGRELNYLAQIVADVEEYGVDLMEPNDLQPMKEWFAAPSQQAVVSEGMVEALREIAEWADQAINANGGIVTIRRCEDISDAINAMLRAMPALPPSSAGEA